MSENNSGEVILALILGGIIGAAVGILYAPRSGKETREKLMDLGEDFADKIEDAGEEVKNKAKDGREASLRGALCAGGCPDRSHTCSCPFIANRCAL